MKKLFKRDKKPNLEAQHSTAQHSTAQHSTAQHSTAQHSTAQHSTAQHKPSLTKLLYSIGIILPAAVLFSCGKETPVLTYTVTFDSQGGLPVPAAQQVESGKQAGPPAPAPTKVGYAFAGWYADEALTTAYDFDSPVTSHITLYAKWDIINDISPDKISFGAVEDSTKTIISMREFVLTVEVLGSKNKDSLSFIVGESETAPDWDMIKDNPVMITRAFQEDTLKSRRIYFSATEKLTGVTKDSLGDATLTGKTVDLSQASSSGQSEAAYTQAEAPGIMVPNTAYHVHAYYHGAYVKSREVTTAGYPTAASDFTAQVGGPNTGTGGADRADYLWSMDAWKNAAGNYEIIKGVEVKQGEVFFLPLRLHSPVDWDLGDGANSFCKNSTYMTNTSLRFRPTRTAYNILVSFSPSGISPNPTANLINFTNSSSLFPDPLPDTEKDEVIDMMYLAKLGGEYDISATSCRDALDLAVVVVDYAYVNINFTLITE